MKLYRYISLNGKVARRRAADALLSNIMYFQSPRQFNDPYDCKTLFNYLRASDEVWRRFFSQLFRVHKPKIDEKTLAKLVDLAMRKDIHNSPDFRESQLNKYRKALSDATKNLGILCMSKVKNNILMWAHYADGHRGICIELNREVLRRHFYLDKVVYRDRYPSFNEFLRLARGNSLHLFLLSKARYWEYEKEWRAIQEIKNHNRQLQLPEGAISGVVLGCQISQRNMNLVTDWIRGAASKIKLYQAARSEVSYGVRIEEIL